MKPKNLRRVFHSIVVALVCLLMPASLSAQIVTVTGKACIYFAGQSTVPDMGEKETAASIPPCVQVYSGGVLSFAAEGLWHHADVGLYGPDGYGGNRDDTRSDYLTLGGISQVIAPRDTLVGVFLTDNPPDPGAMPDSLVLGSSDMTHPEIQQGFAIGSELMNVQVPVGATRLFFGMTDGREWSNNRGEVVVVVYDPTGNSVTGGGWIAQPLLPGDDQFSLPCFKGNYYEMVTAAWIGWDEACEAADAKRDAYGHLVTITSRQEQEFLDGVFGDSLEEKWFGGFQVEDPADADPAVDWYWVTGEPWDYTKWALGEPNDGDQPEEIIEDGEEQYLMGWPDINVDGTAWNDGDQGVENGGYVVEYEGSELPTARANFGFNAKHKKDDIDPTGHVEFQFQAGDINFHANSCEGLVIGPGNACLWGTGTNNGSGGFEFMIWVSDGDPDTFRIKIWQDDGLGGEIVLYDAGVEQPLEGGAIVIHTK